MELPKMRAAIQTLCWIPVFRSFYNIQSIKCFSRVINSLRDQPWAPCRLWGPWNSCSTQGAGSGEPWLCTASTEHADQAGQCHWFWTACVTKVIPWLWDITHSWEHHSPAGQLRAAAHRQLQLCTAAPFAHWNPAQHPPTCYKCDCFPPSFCPQPVSPHPTENQNGNNWTWAVLKGGQQTGMAASPQDLSQYSLLPSSKKLRRSHNTSGKKISIPKGVRKAGEAELTPLLWWPCSTGLQHDRNCKLPSLLARLHTPVCTFRFLFNFLN